MVLLQRGSGGAPGGLRKWHSGARVQQGYGLLGTLGSFFSKALPYFSKAAKSTAAAASRFGKSQLGQELKSSLISAAGDSAISLLEGRSPTETLGTHLEDARGESNEANRPRGQQVMTRDSASPLYLSSFFSFRKDCQCHSRVDQTFDWSWRGDSLHCAASTSKARSLEETSSQEKKET